MASQQNTDAEKLAHFNTAALYPRRTAFIGTVNREDALSDPTGSTRFAVFTAEKIDYQHAIDMQQFWAQMLHEWREEGAAGCFLTREEEADMVARNKRYEVGSVEQDALEAAFDWSDAGLDAMRDAAARRGKAAKNAHFWANARLLELFSPRGDRRALHNALTRLGAMHDNKLVKVGGAPQRGWWMPPKQ